MAQSVTRPTIIVSVFLLLLVSSISSAEQQQQNQENKSQNAISSSSKTSRSSGYQHIWPDIDFDWKIFVGSIIGFFGAACGSVGGVGGGGIFVPMLTLIIGFDPKSSTAISKCMITGTAMATVFYNIRQRHPTLELPLIDYDLALLMQPMLILGISIGVAFNVIFADWMITVLLIIVFIVMSTKSFFKGVETWKKETIAKEEAAIVKEFNGPEAEEFKRDPESLPNPKPEEESSKPKRPKVPLIENVYWKEIGILVAVWIVILALQLIKNYKTSSCSTLYWVLNALQIPVAGVVSAYVAIGLYKGKRRISSKGEGEMNWRVNQLLLYCLCGVIAGVLGGLLGLGGGFILGPLFLEIGIPPQVASATSTFAMAFSSSMSVVEYYLLKRFPVPYALYLFAVATVAAFAGQYVVKKIIKLIGRASIIIFVLSFTIIISACLLGGIGVAEMVRRMKHKEYMGFDDICSYKS